MSPSFASHTRRTASHFTGIPLAPPDAIVGLNDSFKADSDPRKVNVGVGAYRTDEGKPFVLTCVRQAEGILAEQLKAGKLDQEYSPISGCQEFIGNSIEFAYGKRADNIQGVQTLSGTGGLRIFGEYLNKFFPKKNIYVPNPTWGNHIPIMQNAGLEVRKYRYYDFENRKVDFEGLIEDMDAADDGSCFLLHACAHNPTGYDLSDNEWKQVSDIMLRKNHLPFFDCAYQGFASGNAETDAKAIRLFEDEGHTFGLVQSYSKNFGLYGQRVGCLSIVGKDAEEAKAVVSQFKGLIRPAYSNPPRHGVRIINTILGDESMKALFVDECKFMADRINSMRVELVNNLIATGSTRNWDHVTNQIGMFAFSGLTKDEVIAMRDRHHIYCTLDGRISMAGVTTKNVKYIADSIHDVTK